MSNTKIVRSINTYTNMPVLTIYGADFKFPNFRGKVDPVFNREGKRSFNVVIPDEYAQQLIDEDWYIRLKMDKNGNPYYALKVNVSYRYRGPDAFLVDSKHPGGEPLGEDDIGELDTIPCTNYDIEVQASQKWVSQVDGREYYGCYLRTIYAVRDENVSQLAAKYAQFANSSEEADLPF